MCACALDAEAAEGRDSDAGDEGGVGAAALLDALRDWFAEEFTAFLVEGEQAVGAVDHFHGWVVAVLFHGAACARNGDMFAEVFQECNGLLILRICGVADADGKFAGIRDDIGTGSAGNTAAVEGKIAEH